MITYKKMCFILGEVFGPNCRHLSRHGDHRPCNLGHLSRKGKLEFDMIFYLQTMAIILSGQTYLEHDRGRRSRQMPTRDWSVHAGRARITIGRRRINLWIDTARVLDTVTYQGGSGLLRRFGVAASVKHDLCNGPGAYKRLRS